MRLRRRGGTFLAAGLLLLASDGLALDVPASLGRAEEALAAHRTDDALPWIDRALESDPRSLAAWDLRARWAEAAANRDELAYSLYRGFRLSVAQSAPRKEVAERRSRLLAVDPQAKQLLDFTSRFTAKLLPWAERFEKQDRRHAAIRLHSQLLALDPERTESREAIERISAAPDPSLAETAKPKDLLADVSAQWIAEHDARHDRWETASKLERSNYTTQTDAGYEVMVRAAEAMEHMNAFYRRFFHHAEDGKGVPRITLRIFRTHDEYLKLGTGPPVKWSGGQFTGSAVETYIGEGGFAETTNTLFHEAAHQFVGLATTSAGWLNEGLASFFEGSHMLANGTVRTNLPANHRLFPLADRLAVGWMSSPEDGMPPFGEEGPDPEKAPTFRMVVENRYLWGPAWYAPTWGVVYFLYDYQDPNDGRFVYREAFHNFVNASGARTGKGAAENFERIVLAHPAKPTPGFKLPEGAKPVALPRTIGELDEVWRTWILDLRDEQAGRTAARRPYLAWARCAIERKDWDDATEHFENGLEAAPDDFDLCVEFAEHLAARGRNADRAVKLLLHAQRVVEAGPKPDIARTDRVERLLARFDPAVREIQKIEDEMAVEARRIAQAYATADLPLMTMDATRRFGSDLGVPGMFELYETAARRASRSLATWERAYDEKDLRRWSSPEGSPFQAADDEIRSRFGRYVRGDFQYRALAYDRVTSGDFSIETEVQVERGKGGLAGLVFGMKGPSAFHALVFFPGATPGTAKEGDATSAYVDLTSFFDAGSFKVWRHNPVTKDGAGWHTLRADLAGRTVDVWFDGDLVVSQEFASPEVLHGGFGLFTGTGEARFRNVRFLARDKADVAAQIERKIRMEAIRAKGGAVGGSWIGLVPPFPETVQWVRNPRSSWFDKGAVPTLLVFWSVKQDNVVPVRAWLQEVVKKYADVGLEVVAVSQPEELQKVEQHLEYEPIPGAVCVDGYADPRARFGATFEAYSVGTRFSLPRLLLLDVDGKVVWEGDPGFRPNEPWKSGTPTYLDAPLQSLLDRRRLPEIGALRRAWTDRGAAAAEEGDFAAVWPLLSQAAALPSEDFPDVARLATGARSLTATLASAESLDRFARELAAEGQEPALVTLLDWAKAMKSPVRPSAATAPLVTGGAAAAWSAACRKAQSAAGSLAAGRELETLRALAADLGSVPGFFPKALARDLAAAVADGDVNAAKRLCLDADRRPARWLLRDAFRISPR